SGCESENAVCPGAFLGGSLLIPAAVNNRPTAGEKPRHLSVFDPTNARLQECPEKCPFRPLSKAIFGSVEIEASQTDSRDAAPREGCGKAGEHQNLLYCICCS